MKKRIIGLRGDLWTQLLIDEFQLHSVLNPIDFVSEWELNMAEYISSNGVSVLPGGITIFLTSVGSLLNHPLINKDTKWLIVSIRRTFRWRLRRRRMLEALRKKLKIMNYYSTK